MKTYPAGGSKGPPSSANQLVNIRACGDVAKRKSDYARSFLTTPGESECSTRAVGRKQKCDLQLGDHKGDLLYVPVVNLLVWTHMQNFYLKGRWMETGWSIYLRKERLVEIQTEHEDTKVII